jgi:hypothetical protein
MFADDTQLINKTEESIEETFKTLEIYEKASGAKMNLEKTVGIHQQTCLPLTLYQVHFYLVKICLLSWDCV